jgi:hypothetical protein
MRSFSNMGELGTAPGLSYQIKIGKSDMLTVYGGYNFRLWQGKWYYLGNKIDFPKADLRGWEIGISWCTLQKRCPKEVK